MLKWLRTGKTDRLQKMLTTAQLGTPPPDWPEPDIYDYGVERILIVEHDILVDLDETVGFEITAESPEGEAVLTKIGEDLKSQLE